MASGFPWQTEFALAYLYLATRLPAIAEPGPAAPDSSAGAAPRSRHARGYAHDAT